MQIPKYAADTTYRGTSGYQTVSDIPFHSKSATAFIEAGKELGYGTPDINGPTQIGFSYHQVSFKPEIKIIARFYKISFVIQSKFFKNFRKESYDGCPKSLAQLLIKTKKLSGPLGYTCEIPVKNDFIFLLTFV